MTTYTQKTSMTEDNTQSTELSAVREPVLEKSTII